MSITSLSINLISPSDKRCKNPNKNMALANLIISYNMEKH